MRYLGNKKKLLDFISSVIDKYNIEGETFADLFSGTSSVGDHFKEQYNIISNDYMYFASIIAKAKLSFEKEPEFKKFVKKFNIDPFSYFNEKKYQIKDNYFITNNYTPIGNRMYFSEKNATKIDGIRLEIEELYRANILSESEYAFLIASLLYSTLKISNTTGTYQAFLKFWESRALKELVLFPIEFNRSEFINDNQIYCRNVNELVREIEGDIAYIDPPYTINQYANSYHILETIAKYDYPDIFGKTGRRVQRELSAYSNKNKAIIEFEDLFRQINFKHVLLSYSNQSLIPIDELVDLARKFAINQEVFIEEIDYREYATNNPSYKGKNGSLKECILYFKKDRAIKKSALNYSGSKDKVLPILYKYMPKHIDTFVDAMGGAFNVGLNVVAMNKVVYNEKNPYIYRLVEYLISNNKDTIIKNIKAIICDYNLEKKGKESYLKLRNDFNKNQNRIDYLYALHIYAFQNMIRFNSNYKMNTPVGNNEFSSRNMDRIRAFIPKTKSLELFNDDYIKLNLKDYEKDTLFYFDPPYFISKAEYNDGKRGFDGWSVEQESQLLDFLTKLDEMGYKFILSNVMEHKGKKNNLLQKWADTHNYKIIEIGRTGRKYPRIEVIVLNYDLL